MGRGVDDRSHDRSDGGESDGTAIPIGGPQAGQATDGRPYVMVLAVAPWVRPRPEPVLPTAVSARH